jgi:3',5'-cyclic AMP phosphodiesterase CpdA
VPVELTTVADDAATFHDGTSFEHLGGLEPDTPHEHAGISFRTLPRPSGALRCRIGTVNDVHFGEVEAGRLDDVHTDGPILRVAPGEAPYPETMNRAAVAEMAAARLDAVVVKGDLTNLGTADELAAFAACYAPLGDRLHVVRGNHDAMAGIDAHTGDRWIELPGVAVALLDTVRPGHENGQLSAAQIDWLDAGAASATVPVLVMGHHQQFLEGGNRSPDYFGIDPDASDALTAVMRRRPAIVAYTAGHTHRHRVRRIDGVIPTVEVGCVKDFPGTWAEYRVYDGGILQVVHRISTPDALAWSERCRALYSDFGLDYGAYAMGALDDRCFAITLR